MTRDAPLKPARGARASWPKPTEPKMMTEASLYINPDKREFDLDQPRPRTPREQAEYDRRQQEAAGQMRLL